MVTPEYRLVSSALLLNRFTLEELVSSSGVNRNTCRSWLTRNRPLFTEVEGQRASGRGRPAKRFRLTSEGSIRLRKQVGELCSTLEEASSDRCQESLLDAVESKLRLWQAVSAGCDGAGAAEHAALQSTIFLAWEEFGGLHGAGVPTDEQRLKRLAEMEREARFADVPDVPTLPETALWLAKRMERIRSRGFQSTFAAHTLWVRASVRSELDTARVVAAALGAAVWSDEELGGSEVPQRSLIDCRMIAESASMSQRIRYCWGAVQGRATPTQFVSDADAQAVARGLTSCSDASRSDELHDALSGAKVKNWWRACLAPVVVHGLLEAPSISLKSLVADLGESLERGLEYHGVEGALRRDALTWGRRVLSYVGRRPSPDPRELINRLNWRPERDG